MEKLNIKENFLKKKMQIPFFFAKREHLFLKKKLINSISKSLLHGKTLQGPEVSKLENLIIKYTGKKYAVAVGSCTDALFFSLKALGIKRGDEVIVTSYSYLASATCILRCEAKPVFIDVDKNGNMLLDEVEKKITKKTRAIIYVHLFGYMQNIDKLKKITKKRKLYLIEDFAQALGAQNKTKKAGSIGDISCTSFDPTKVLSAPGSGGMAFTNDKKIKDKLVKMRYHGKSYNGDHDDLGINSQLSSINASALLVKLKNLKTNQKKRINIAKKYINFLSSLPIRLPPKFKDNRHIYHKFVIQTNLRDQLYNYLKQNGIEAVIHYKKTISKLSLFKKYKAKTLNADYLSDSSISIPIHPYLENKEIKYIIDKINQFFKEKLY